MALDGAGFGEDPTIDAAAMKILELGPDALGFAAPGDDPKRENRTDRDPIEKTRSTDLEEAEDGDKAPVKADDKDEKEPAKAAEEDGADYIEIEGAEGEEAERVPLAEAIEAIKQSRELKNGIAEVVNRAETEAEQKMQGVLQSIQQVQQEVVRRAQMALQVIPAPTPPPRTMLDPSHPSYDPNSYHLQYLQYEDQAAAYAQIGAAAKEAQERAQAARADEIALVESRENQRLARYWPEWKDDAKREAIQNEMLEGLQKHYGLSAKEVEDVRDHRFLLIARDALRARAMKTDAPAIKAEVEKRATARVVKGNAAAARNADGRFASNAMKELEQTGSEASFAKYLLSSGALR